MITAWFRIPCIERRFKWRSSFDRERHGVISYFHVLEHVWDPVTSLSTARALLDKSGLLVVEVPFFDSLPWKIFGTMHRHFYRGHRSDFNAGR